MDRLSNYPAAVRCYDMAKDLLSKEALPKVLIPMPKPFDVRLAAEMARDGLMIPILVGEENSLKAAWDQLGNPKGEIVGADGLQDVCDYVKQAVDGGQIDVMGRGGLPIHEVVDVIKESDTTIVSHAAAVVMPEWERFLVISDGGWNLLPTLEESEGIIRNAITLLTALGIDVPKIALLSAVEDIDSRIPRTMEAASLSHMAHRWAFDSAVVDGPLRFDHAIALPRGYEPPFRNPVTGNADAVIAGSLDEANVLIKALRYLGNAINGGVLIGGTIPVAWHGRDASRECMLLSLMMAVLVWAKSKGRN
jgi:phosphate acetyltransferase